WGVPVTHSDEERGDAARLIAGSAAGDRDQLGVQRLKRKGGKYNVFDTETGIDRVEPLLEQRRNMAQIAARTGGAEADALDLPVNAMKGKFKPPRSGPLSCQARDEIGDEPLSCQHQI